MFLSLYLEEHLIIMFCMYEQLLTSNSVESRHVVQEAFGVVFDCGKGHYSLNCMTKGKHNKMSR